MLRKKYRLPRGIGFAKSQAFFSPFFTLRIKNNGLDVCRFGFIVSKKIDKRAVVRNKIKRQIRSCIEKRLNDIVAGKDMLFILKEKSKDRKKEEICGNTLSVLKERGLLLLK